MLPARARVVRGDARRDPDRRGRDARHEPADAARHLVPDPGGGRGRGHHRARTASRRSTRSRRTCPRVRERIAWDAGAARRVARPRRARGGGRRRRDAGGPDRARRPDDPLLHQRHGQLPEDGAASAVLRARARVDRPLLARPAPGGPALDRHRHGLGQGRLGRAVRPVARARRDRPGRARQARRRHDPVDPARPGHHLVLRAADALPDAGAGRPRAATTSPALRHCTSAGEPLNPEVIRAWKDGTGGLVVYDGYGQSETTVLVANYRAVPVRPGSMGKPVPGWDVEVLDEATGEPRAGRHGRQHRRARHRPAPGRACSTATTGTTTPTRPPSAAAGTSPATRPGATRTATSGSRAATTT